MQSDNMDITAPAPWSAAMGNAGLLQIATDFTRDGDFPEEAQRLAGSAFAGGGATEERFRATLARVCGWAPDLIDETVVELRCDERDRAAIADRVAPWPTALHDDREPGAFARSAR